MTESFARRPLALTAVIATSVAAAAGMIAPAHATTGSPDGVAKLTLSGGSATTPTTTSSVSGVTYDLKAAANSVDLAWAPTGTRAAWVDKASGQVLTGVPGGATTPIAAAPAGGVIRAHPAWIDGGSRVVWSEKDPGKNGGLAVLKWAYGSGLETDGSGAPITHDFRSEAGLNLSNADGVGSLLIFQKDDNGISPPSVWALDTSQPNSTPYKVADWAWQPSLSPDGKTVAFVGNKSNTWNLFTVPSADPGATLATPVQVTGDATAGTNQFAYPVWTPDGKALVFEALTGTNDTDTKAVVVGAAPTTTYTQVVSGTAVTGLPAFQPLVKEQVTRLAGNDRLDTAIQASQSHWLTAGAANSAGHPMGFAAKAVVLSRSDNPADALGGSALAAKVDGPLLLTQTAALSPAVKAEIQRVLGPGDGVKTVYVLGGTAALSPAVEKALTDLNYHVQRVAGPDRYSTAVEIAKTITVPGGAPDYILLATGANFPDALGAGAAAGMINAHRNKNAVVLLTNDTAMPKATVDYLAPLNGRTKLNADGSKPADFIELDTIGGQAAKAAASPWIPSGSAVGSYYPITGADRYDTSFKVATYFFGGTNGAGLATGTNWADALSGGALMGSHYAPMLLVSPTAGPSADVLKYLTTNSGQFVQVDIFGGYSALPASIDGTIGAAITGPAGVDYTTNPKVP